MKNLNHFLETMLKVKGPVGILLEGGLDYENLYENLHKLCIELSLKGEKLHLACFKDFCPEGTISANTGDLLNQGLLPKLKEERRIVMVDGDDLNLLGKRVLYDFVLQDKRYLQEGSLVVINGNRCLQEERVLLESIYHFNPVTKGGEMDSLRLLEYAINIFNSPNISEEEKTLLISALNVSDIYKELVDNI